MDGTQSFYRRKIDVKVEVNDFCFLNRELNDQVELIDLFLVQWVSFILLDFIHDLDEILPILLSDEQGGNSHR